MQMTRASDKDKWFKKIDGCNMQMRHLSENISQMYVFMNKVFICKFRI